MKLSLKTIRQEQDLPLLTVYSDKHIRAQAILPGIETLRQFPVMAGKTIVFKKQYLTPDAQPLKRGETPEREFKNAKTARTLAPKAAIPEPFGFTSTTFYGEFVEGKEMAEISPLPKNEKELLHPCQPPACGWETYINQLEILHNTITSLHKKGILHGDLHTGNILFGKNKFTLIDWGSATIHKQKETEKFRAAALDDLLEVERELWISCKNAQTSPKVKIKNDINLNPQETLETQQEHNPIGLKP
jgi:serine/threonine-protein kinase RIO1